MRVMNQWKSGLAGMLLCALLLTGCATGNSETIQPDRETPAETTLGIWLASRRQKWGSDAREALLAHRYRQSDAFQMAYGYQGPFLTREFDREWLKADREHFIQLHQMPESRAKSLKMLQEVRQLREHQQQVIHRVKARHPHYSLYGPRDTDEINSLFIAIRARQEWLRDDVYSGIKEDWTAYYPEAYEYAFFQMQHLSIQGGVETAAVELMEDFSAYDEGAVIDFLDSLPVPRKVYQGKEIFFVNGYNADYGAVHANGQILVFNLFEDKEDMLKLIAHEIGHEAGYLIFGRDHYENENHEMKAAYAALYDREVPVDERTIWEMRLSENFAEDFAWVYGGFPKWTYWQGAEEGVIRDFIETQLAERNLDEVILIRDNLQVTADGTTMTFFGGVNEDHFLVITDPELTITIDGFYLGPYGLFAHNRNNVTGNLPRQLFDSSGSITLPLLTLSEEQRRMEEEGYVTYEVQVKMYHYTSLRKYHQPTIARFRVLVWQDQ